MIKNFVKILELLGDRLEVCVSVLLYFYFRTDQVKPGHMQLLLSRSLDLPERPELPERPPKYRKDQRIIGKY